MKKNIFVSVSLDPVKEYSKIVEYAKSLQGHADLLHCDVMDGKFVERTTFDANLVKNINENTLTMLDVHLMCKEPLNMIDDYLNAGANIITVHYEAFENKEDIMKVIEKVKKSNALVGLSIKPKTPAKDIKVFLHDIDLVLVMSVEPGLSGQSFMPESLDKMIELDEIREKNDYKYKIEVDGGVNDNNVRDCVIAGADIIVSGSYIYNSKKYSDAINSLKKYKGLP